MKIFDNIFKKNSNKSKKTNFKQRKNFPDASMIPIEECKYYQPDDYYTIVTHKDTPFEFIVIPFEERKKTSVPSKRGLYVPEILMLSFCKSFPEPKKGYPGYWWFQYGIRDVGKLLSSLEERGFITINPKTRKYMTTDLGDYEKADNAYVEYTHKHSKLSSLTPWNMNKIVNDNPDKDWLVIFCDITGQPKPIERSDYLDEYNLVKESKKIKERITVQQLKNENDFERGFDEGYPHYLKGEEFRKAGYMYSALDEFDEARAVGYSVPALYWSYAMVFRKLKDYGNEVKILEEAFNRRIVGTNSTKFVERKAKAQLLRSKNR